MPTKVREVSVAQKRVALYVRVSSEDQKAGYSIESQIAGCRQWCEERRHLVVDVYEDTRSGKYLWQRAGLQRLLADAQAGRIDMVLCYDTDRAFRNQNHIAMVDDQLENLGIELTSVRHSMDRTALGKAMRGLRTYAAEQELEQITERTTRGKKTKVETGKPLGAGHPGFGFRWVMGEVVREGKKRRTPVAVAEEPDTAEIVRLMFRWIADGGTIRGLQLKFSEEGVKTPRGGAIWQTSSISKLLRNEKYTGRAYAWQHETEIIPRGEHLHIIKRHRPREEWVELPEGTYPRLVEDSLFYAVQTILTENQKAAHRRSKRPEDFLLRGGYALCASCGHPLRAQIFMKKPYYMCRRGIAPFRDCSAPVQIAAALVDDDVWHRISQLLKRPEVIRAELIRRAVQDGNQDRLKGYDKQLVDLAKTRDNLIENLKLMSGAAIGIMSGELNKITERFDALAIERAAIADTYGDENKLREAIDNFVNQCEAVGEILDEAPYEKKRAAIKFLGTRVVVNRGYVTPRFVPDFQVSLPVISVHSEGLECTLITLSGVLIDQLLRAA